MNSFLSFFLRTYSNISNYFNKKIKELKVLSTPKHLFLFFFHLNNTNTYNKMNKKKIDLVVIVVVIIIINVNDDNKYK